ITGERIKILEFVSVDKKKGDAFASPFSDLHRDRRRNLLGGLALRSFASRLLGSLADRLLGGLLRGLALHGLADRLLRNLLRRLLGGGLLNFLSHCHFLIGFCLVVVGWELFDSPAIFFAEFGLQVVSASTRANFSARSIFSTEERDAISLRALFFKARRGVRAHKNDHERGCARR